MGKSSNSPIFKEKLPNSTVKSLDFGLEQKLETTGILKKKMKNLIQQQIDAARTQNLMVSGLKSIGSRKGSS